MLLDSQRHCMELMLSFLPFLDLHLDFNQISSKLPKPQESRDSFLLNLEVMYVLQGKPYVLVTLIKQRYRHFRSKNSCKKSHWKIRARMDLRYHWIFLWYHLQCLDWMGYCMFFVRMWFLMMLAQRNCCCSRHWKWEILSFFSRRFCSCSSWSYSQPQEQECWCSTHRWRIDLPRNRCHHWKDSR